MKNFLRALRYFRPDLLRLAVVFGLLVCSMGTNLLKPWPLALMVDCVLSGKAFPAWLDRWMPADPLPQVGILAILLFLAYTMHGLLTAAHHYLGIAIGLRGLMRVRNDMFDWLQRLSLRFHRCAKVGDLIHRAAWDTYAFQTLFQQGLLTSFGALISVVLMVIVMTRVHMRLTLVVIATVPLLLAVMIVFGRKMQQRGLAAQRTDSEVTARVQQNIAALPLIQSYTREELERARFQTQSDEARQKRLTQHASELLYSLAVALVFGLATAWMVWLGNQAGVDATIDVWLAAGVSRVPGPIV
jgi:ABC-type multidrug transport system fused ATPase/permease subunit